MSELLFTAGLATGVALIHVLRKIRDRYAHNVWPRIAYVSANFLFGVFVVLLLKEGWLERIGLERTTPVVLVTISAVCYWLVVALKDSRGNL